MKKRDPQKIVETVVAHFKLNARRLIELKRPKFSDHAEGYGKASLIMQSLALMLTGMTAKQLAPVLNRTENSITSARRKLEVECRTDPKLRADITAILRSL